MDARRVRTTMLAAVAALSFPVAGNAAETGGCDSFAWPLATELAWMKAGDATHVQSGATIAAPPAKAIRLRLLPKEQVAYPVPPTGKPKEGKPPAFGGIVSFATASGPGLYQVTLSAPAWVDVVQDGKALRSEAHTGKSDCDGVRKSVRFTLADGPFTVEISDAWKDSITLAIRRAD